MTRWKAVQVLILACLLGEPLRSQQSPRSLALPASDDTPQSASRDDSSTDAGSRLRALSGTKVATIEIQSDVLSPTERTTLLRQLPQQAGTPFDRRAVRESVQLLAESGKFADVRVEVENLPEGLHLVFATEANFFVGGLFIDGVPRYAPRAAQLLTTSKFQLGELFTSDKLTTSYERMETLLEDNGYFQSTVTADLARNLQKQQVDIYFHVRHGAVARIQEVKVEGDLGFTPDEVRKTLHLLPGKPVNNAQLRKGLEKLRKRYQRRDRLEAQIDVSRTAYHPDSNTVDYAVRIDRGPIVDIRLDGASLSKRLMRRYIPVYEENAVDDDLLNEGRRNLRDHFQSAGFFDVRVDVNQQAAGQDRQDIVFGVRKGDRHTLREVKIIGNQYFEENTIRERMEVQPATYLLRHGRFSQSLMARDVSSIENLYRANGFRSVVVNAEVKEGLRGKPDELQLLVNIQEGPQTRVQQLKIEGNQKISDEQLRGLVNMTERQPFSEVNIATDRDSLVTYYYDQGFPEVQFEASYEPVSADPPRMAVLYRIREGKQVFIDQVYVSGLKHTHPDIVERQLRVHSGEPLSQGNMLETQRRLYDLGIFNEVDVAMQNPEGDATRKNVLVQVEEAKRWTLNYGLGFEVQTGGVQGTANQPQGRTGFSPRGSFDVTRLNFRGRDQTILFKSRVGRLQQRVLLSFEAPRYLGHDNMKLSLTGFYDNTRDVRTFTAERLEGSAQVEHVWSRATTLLYRFAYRRVKVDPSSLAIDPNLIPLFSRSVRVGIPSVTWIHDKRDDPLDAHKGTYTTFDTGVASRFFGSEASFARFFAQNSSYYPFDRKRWVFARSTRLGIEEPFGDRLQNFVPLPERYFGGGGNSLRGIAINQAGPRDLQTGFPLGGEAIFVNNLELRTPPIPLPYAGENLSAVIFHDMGNVFATAKDLFPALGKVSQDSVQNCKSQTTGVPCDFAYVSHQVGLGFRYKTPIGPVRADFGVNLNPAVFPVRDTNHYETLKRFNFVLSIGQAF